MASQTSVLSMPPTQFLVCNMFLLQCTCYYKVHLTQMGDMFLRKYMKPLDVWLWDNSGTGSEECTSLIVF